MRMVHVQLESVSGKLIVETKDPIAEIPTQESKATVAGWSFLDKYIIMGHENGMVSQWDWKVFPLLKAMLALTW